jgi:hypothetical protein
MLTYRAMQWDFATFCPRSSVSHRRNLPWRREHCCFKRRAIVIVNGGKAVIRKLSSGKYRLYSRNADPRTGRRRNLGTFKSRSAAEKHERAVQYFKHHA